MKLGKSVYSDSLYSIGTLSVFPAKLGSCHVVRMAVTVFESSIEAPLEEMTSTSATPPLPSNETETTQVPVIRICRAR